MKPTADICLLLEGTYPFVRGGVSAWLHQLIANLPSLRFALVFLGGRRADYGDPHYALPANVVHLEAHYLEDSLRGCRPRQTRMSDAQVSHVRALHEELDTLAVEPASGSELRAIDEMLDTLETGNGVRITQFLYGKRAWDVMRDECESRECECAFLDYFWTQRLLHGPLFFLARIADQVPDARVFHSISTGYAGFLGAILQRRRARPLILSEHGIYTKERRIDLNQTDWFDPGQDELQLGPGEPRAELRALWIRYFESLGRIAYRAADPIVALSEGNRQRQIADGAPLERTRIVSNGVAVASFEAALFARPEEVPRVIGLVGRVVPIKDVKTFVRSIAALRLSLPNVEGWVIGGAEEEPAYLRECQALALALGLDTQLKFLGHRQTREVLPKLGLLMLTSISEGQPLAILEALAAGVPCVATDVGACRELIEGRDDADRAIGRAGRVVPFADEGALAGAALELLSDSDEWSRCQAAGLQRVRTLYEEQFTTAAYERIYLEAFARAQKLDGDRQATAPARTGGQCGRHRV